MVHFLSQNKSSGTRTGLYITGLLVKEVSWQCPVNPSHCQDYRLLFTNWGQGPIADDTYTTHWKYRSQAVPIQTPSSIGSIILGTRQSSKFYQERKKIQNQPQFLDLQWCSACKTCQDSDGSKTEGETNQRHWAGFQIIFLVWEIIPWLNSSVCTCYKGKIKASVHHNTAHPYLRYCCNEYKE